MQNKELHTTVNSGCLQQGIQQCNRY